MNYQVTQQKETVQYGLLLINMGGPESLIDIYDYLFRLFSDPLIVNLPAFFRTGLARFLAFSRKRKSTARYSLIGGRSPLKEETRALADRLQESLRIPVAYAMRYTEPFIAAGKQELYRRGVTYQIVLPMYPQYSRSTTLSAIDDFLTHKTCQTRFSFIKKHYDYPAFIKAQQQLLNEALKQRDSNLKSAVLFAAHAIPLKQVRSGDPYVDQVKATVSGILAGLELTCPSDLAFQSRIGPVKWQGPTLEKGLQKFRRLGVEQLIIHPVSFVTENLETLFDLDIEFRQACIAAGIKKYIRVPAPGTYPAYISAISSLVKEEISNLEVKNGPI